MVSNRIKKQNDKIVNQPTQGSQTFSLTNTDALVKQIQATLVENAKAEFAAVIQELNDSRDSREEN